MENEKIIIICPICGKAELTPNSSNENNSNLCYWNTNSEEIWLGCDNCGHSFKMKKER